MMAARAGKRRASAVSVFQTIRDWVLRFNAREPDGLVDGKAPGRAPKLNGAQCQELGRIIESGPIPAIHLLALHKIIPHVVGQVKASLLREMVPASAKMAAEAQRTNRDTVQRAVNRLKELDEFLRARGFQHLIYLSPSRASLEHSTPPDALVASTLDRASIRVQRLQNRLESTGLDATGIASLYHDGVHLSRRGHQVWASIIKPDVEAAIVRANRQTWLGLQHVRFPREPNYKTFRDSLAGSHAVSFNQ